jgi:hypothetical protein
MAHPEQAHVNGAGPQGQPIRPIGRPYTVDEALPLTPYTSILPLESGTVHQPYFVRPSLRLPLGREQILNLVSFQ